MASGGNGGTGVGEVLQFRGQLRVGRPERAGELVVRPQHRRLVREHPKEGSDVAARCERFKDAFDVRTCSLVGNRFDAHRVQCGTTLSLCGATLALFATNAPCGLSGGWEWLR